MEKSTRKISSSSSHETPSDITHHFFKVYLPSFSLHNLKIPTMFMKKLNGVISEIATLKDPVKRLWHVEVKKVKNTFYFQNGWEEFVKCNCLKTGDFMVFSYAGNSVFYVDMFDNSECEKRTKKLNQTTTPVEEEDDIIFMKKLDKVTSPSVEEEEVESDDQMSSDYVLWSSEGEDSVEKICNGETEESSDPDGFIESELPFFIASLRTPNRHSVHIPSKLVNRADIEVQQNMVLRDPNQRTWPVIICFMKDRTIIGKGWFDFWRGNNLNPGDRCIFEFQKYKVAGISKNSSIIDVKFIRGTRKKSSTFQKSRIQKGTA